MLYSLLAFLLGTLLGVSTQRIHQWPAVRVQPVGSSLSLECTITGKSNPNLYWYWQATGGTLQQLFYSINVGEVQSVVSRNLSASRPKDGQFTLSSKKLLLSHSGFYFCAWSLTLRGVGQASVQKPHPFLSPTTLTRSPR
uniref:T cell receptor beta, variable 31 n=1 Tax=Peromyscus maniculatus bairdii TaxID=230844 RepID=A0A8C8W6U4_PERMB